MKKLIKTSFFALASLTLAISMTACSSIQNNALNIAEKTENTVTMPEQYNITYEVQEPEEDAVTLVSKACDAEGNIYFSNANTELLFLNTEGKYRLFEKDADGSFSESISGKLYTTDYIKTATTAFTECTEQSKNQYTPGFKETEESSVLNRPCRVFENKIGISGMNTTYILQVDKETGICLGYNEIAETGIFTSKPSKTVFSCTEFVAGSVTLPVDISALH